MGSLYANMPFYMRDLSIQRFWYLQGPGTNPPRILRDNWMIAYMGHLGTLCIIVCEGTEKRLRFPWKLWFCLVTSELSCQREPLGCDLRHLGHLDLEWTLSSGPNPRHHVLDSRKVEPAVGRVKIFLVVFTSAFSSSAWEIRFWSWKI